MSSSTWGLAVAVVAIIAGVSTYRWWTSDERAIRNQMSAIAESLTVAASEPELSRVTRIAQLRNALAPDIQVSAPDATAGTRIPGSISGRDAVLGLIARWTPPPGGITVEFVDVQVQVGSDPSTAHVYSTAKVTSGPAERPTIDARELTVLFSRIDGDWLVSSVRPEQTLAR